MKIYKCPSCFRERETDNVLVRCICGEEMNPAINKDNYKEKIKNILESPFISVLDKDVIKTLKEISE